MIWSYGHASLVQCQVERLTLRLSARLFDAELWATIKAWFQTDVRASHWRSAPFRVMTAKERPPMCRCQRPCVNWQLR